VTTVAKYLIWLVALPLCLHAQDKAERWLLVADAGVRTLDCYSTHQMLQNGGREIILPDAIAHHAPAMAAFSAATVIVDWQVARLLEHHHHPKVARWLTIADMSADAPWAVHNLFIRKKAP
jgi:hypothetical protein